MSHPSLKMVTFGYGGLCGRTHEAVIAELLHCMRNQITVKYQTFSGTALICKARSTVASEYMLNDSLDVLFLLDHDMWWAAGAVAETCKLAHERQAIVACLYSKRALGRGWACSDDEPMSMNIGGDAPRFQKCSRLATGFMAIPKSCLLRIYNKHNINSDEFKKEFKEHVMNDRFQEAYEMDQCGLAETWAPNLELDAEKAPNPPVIDFFRTLRVVDPKGNHVYFSEDFSFCWRARKAGVELGLNLHHGIVHVGEHAFTVEDGDPKKFRKTLNAFETVEKQCESGNVPNASNTATGQQDGAQAVQEQCGSSNDINGSQS